jgi:hypothetical protein
VTDIPIYDTNGVQVDSFFIDDILEPAGGRVSRGNKAFYKGAGVEYDCHFVRNPGEGYDFLEPATVFYVGDMVTKTCFEGKSGVFQEPYQDHFTDWIGACGDKELQIVENLWELGFERTAIDVKEWTQIGPGQCYVTCDYPYDRIEYLDASKPDNLFTLIAYMIDSDWNFPWDKDSIHDVHSRGLITDVADLFMSKELKHKVGTVYSILYSLGMNDHERYKDFCDRYFLEVTSQMSYVLNSLDLLMRLGVDISPCMRDTHSKTYKHTVRNYLVEGKNCGYCGVGSCKNRVDSNVSIGDEVRDYYIRQAERAL